MYRALSCLLAGLVTAQAALAEPLADVFVSKATRVTVVELFTSEGCSSCPPAERWLGRLKDDPHLWQDLVPLAFHVDYWDYLGWRDEFADARFSERQRKYERAGNIASVYTPGIVVNGGEWRSFFNPLTRNAAFPVDPGEPGILVLTVGAEELTIDFKGDPEAATVANVAWIGTGIKRRIARGENAGKLLTHDFVVLAHRQATGKGHWRFANFPAPPETTAIAAWISAPADPTPIQAVGGRLAALPR